MNLQTIIVPLISGAGSVSGWANSVARHGGNDYHWKENTMNWDVIAGDWKQFKGQVKEQWGKLTDDNLDTIAGKRDQLAGRIQETYGITKDQAELQVKAFEETHKDYRPGAAV